MTPEGVYFFWGDPTRIISFRAPNWQSPLVGRSQSKTKNPVVKFISPSTSRRSLRNPEGTADFTLNTGLVWIGPSQEVAVLCAPSFPVIPIESVEGKAYKNCILLVRGKNPQASWPPVSLLKHVIFHQIRKSTRKLTLWFNQGLEFNFFRSDRKYRNSGYTPHDQVTHIHIRGQPASLPSTLSDATHVNSLGCQGKHWTRPTGHKTHYRL